MGVTQKVKNFEIDPIIAKKKLFTQKLWGGGRNY